MKKLFPTAIAASIMALASAPATAQQQPTAPSSQAATPPSAEVDLRPYPAATIDQKRHVITLPTLADESSAKLEIIVGRTMKIDCNHHFFGGQIEERTAEGWGYNYYVLPDLGQGASTLMGCGNTSRRDAFVTSPNQPLIRYNSKLPVVVYAPQNVDVRYRIWRAEAEQKLP